MTQSIRKDERSTNERRNLDEDLCVHIFTASAGMVGVCLTVIGIIRVVISLRGTDTIADDLLAADAMFYLTSCFLSYWSLRTKRIARSHRIERAADAIFLVALLVTVVAAAVITWAVSVG
ncbi:hypothetical protein EC912_102404 [Luteibacter rhizovicinus]|uniref:Uncharacterized protein n=1 Tax=Luteibacter rhizovicinus TaxID=242606 RepID=A0A4R3YSS5_9GAMM|nr:hypothetical protein [Luteibacter rhizovicinus]TCV96055.1 hypothetical protein EC912_102404 [Luteibacter rhizovicinus]